MIIKKKTINHEDERGIIQDILVNTNVNHVTYLTTKAGCVRGNHYHKKTTQHLYLLKGKMLAASGGHSLDTERYIVNAGELLTHEPLEYHAYYAIEDCEMLAITEGVRGGEDYEKDTYRLDEPILTDLDYVIYEGQ